MNEIKKILDKHQLHPVKNFGQNFLFDLNIIKKIAQATDITNKNVIEIGTGLGHLTNELVKVAKKVVTIEIDKKLISFLQTKFANNNNLKIINADFLTLDLANLINEEFDEQKDIVVVANLPYYLTSPIILRLLENINFFSYFVLMMQKEVALRLTAQPNNKSYNNLSIMTQYYCQTKILFDIKPQSFFPAPKITSSLVKFSANQNLILKNDQKFWNFVRSTFANKRKTLVNNLTVYLNDKQRAIDIIKELDWSLNIRAENLTFIMFYDLYQKINKNQILN